jgi:HPt (histidine-containing phosphotransfer) domain-containing protein
MKSFVLSGIDTAHLNRITAGDSAFAAELVLEFVTVCQNLICAVDGGVEGEDREAVRYAAHTIKGSSRTIGAASLAASASRLESAAASHSDWTSLAALAAECREGFQKLEAGVEKSGLRSAA